MCNLSSIRLAALFCLLCGALSAASRAAENSPYSAYIAVDNAEVVSGPGHRHYATARLPRGAEIEVYAEEASGWLAIRPPEGSFSWVPADFVERSAEDDAIGCVTEPTPAWVGTTAEKVQQHREIVALKTGELVQILGEKQVSGSDDRPQLWLKIAPPAGEFRWVHLRDVSRQPPPEEPAFAAAELASDSESPSFATAIEEDAAVEEEPQRFRPAASAIALRDIAPIESPAKSRPPHSRSREQVEQAQYRGVEAAPSRPLSPDGFVPRKRKGSESQSNSGPPPLMSRSGTPAFSRPKLETPALIADARPASRPATSPVSTSASAPLASSAGVDQIADQIAQLDLELSLMVAQDRSTWNLAGLAQRVNALVESGGDPVMRGRARLLLDKILEFEEAFDVADYGPIAPATGASASASSAEAITSSAAVPRYDGQGWLKPVVSRQSDKPVAPYALVDADGQPVMFVTPSPGMNLNRYLNKQVGVYGRRGYIEALKAGHVTVERIVDLEKVVR